MVDKVWGQRMRVWQLVGLYVELVKARKTPQNIGTVTPDLVIALACSLQMESSRVGCS